MRRRTRPWPFLEEAGPPRAAASAARGSGVPLSASVSPVRGQHAGGSKVTCVTLAFIPPPYYLA